MSFNKENPFLATITHREVLNKPGSQKCTLHISLDISGSQFDYKVGDSIAVYPENSSILVKETLLALKADPDLMIKDPRSQNEMTLLNFLATKANLARVTKKWIQFVCEHAQEGQEKDFLSSLLIPENKDQLKTFIDKYELWDFLKEIKSCEINPHDCLPLFSPLLPRFYSIASSQKVDPNRIDLLIAYFHYKTNEHLRHGVASHYLCEMAEMRTPSIPIYIHPSRGFTIPEDPSKPIIMVGPGTGIAPYRGFMQERVHQNASGENWLFFGDWNEKYDFYYEDYWRQLEKLEHLKVVTAFSRDQETKIYVQHKLLEYSQHIWQLLEKEASFYVCGDAARMAKDVDEALHSIIEKEGHMSNEEAKIYVKKLKEQNRYIRDVY